MRSVCGEIWYNATMATNEKTLLAAYLAVGEDELKRRRVIEKLRVRIGQLGDLSFNHDVFDATTANGSDIAISCNTLPFASPVRLVEVSHADRLSKQDAEILAAYLAAPNASTVLLLSSEKLAKNSRLYKAVAALGKGAVIDCAPMKRYELVKALRSMAVGHGFTMTDRAASKLVELVGEDTVRLDSELRKLALAHRGGDPIGEREVEEFVARTSEAKPWEFVDAFSRRDVRECLRLLPLMGSTGSISLLARCTSRLRELCCAQSLSNRGEAHAIAKALDLPDWRVKNHAAWASNFTPDELRRAFTTARDCEREMKSGSDPDTAFKEWFVNVAARR